MSWLPRVLGGGKARTPAAQEGARENAREDDLQGLMRAGYDCETRGDVQAAERHYREVLQRDARHADAHFYLGRLAAADRRHDEAIALLQKAVELRPGEALYHLALGDALFEVGRFAEAVEAYGASVGLQPDATTMRNNYATALIHLNRRDEARIELERLRSLLPDVQEIHFNLAGIYHEYARNADAVASYRRALELTPGHGASWDNLLLALNYTTEDAASVFMEHRRFGERFARRYTPPARNPGFPRRLRIGYVSPDFRNHVVSRFFEPVLRSHDRAAFEVFCYFTSREHDSVTERLRSLAEHWRDCEELSDADLAARIRSDGIDILVDLAGHTLGNRLGVFAMKPAPVQATYLGYPNTTGLGAVDFRITDACADPPGASDRLHVERLMRLPGAFLCYRPPEETPPVAPPPAAASGVVTFGCFNNFAKLSAPFLDTAAAVLRAVPDSRLLLKARPLSLPEVANDLRERFARAGIDTTRLELRGWERVAKNHLSVYGEVDIALDCFPYAGTTTTCEAMWMGVPVVSLAGDRHAARVGVSLLNAVGLQELVACDREGYVALAAALAGDRRRLAELRGTLRERMKRSPLMDEAGFTRSLERCLLEMWQCTESSATQSPPDERWVQDRLSEASRLRAEGRLADALACCRELLARFPAQQEALALLWNLAFDTGMPGASIDCLQRGIALDEAAAGLHYMLGCALQATGQVGDAISAFRRAVELDPGMAKAHNNLGCVLELAGALEDAGRSYRQAFERDPKLAQALYNLGKVQARIGRLEEAGRYIEQALAIEPRHSDWRCNLGEIRLQQHKIDEAIAGFRSAIELDSGCVDAYAGLAGALLQCGWVEEAVAALDAALALEPANARFDSWRLFCLQYRETRPTQAALDKHRAWAERHARGVLHLTTRSAGAGRPDRRLNIGYVSPDFIRHALASFIEGVLAAHDPREFKVFCYSTAGQEDDTSRRLRGSGCEWRECGSLSDEQLAHRIRADGIDVLVDLAGHAPGGRLLAFARRPAPVQVTWLGYPDTTGLGAMDYRFTDAIADPEGDTDRYHTEKLVRLPGGFLNFTPAPDSPDIAEPPELRAGHVTFGSFNSLARLTAGTVQLWAELLRALPRSRMVLKSFGLGAAGGRQRVLALFADCGIGADRLTLYPGNPSYAEHLERYRDVDVALDVSPYNGLASTCEALWMGVPVVSLAGSRHSSRIGASILTSAGLGELAASSPEQYVASALRLARDSAGRGRLRMTLRERLRGSPLLDGKRFTRELEAAYRTMWQPPR